MHRGFTTIFILIGILVLGGLVGGAFYLGKSTKNPSKQIACTMDAKICPDGTGVGRTGPNCEFAECPQQVPPVPSDEIKKGHPKVESVLYQLYQSENHLEFAEIHNLDLINDQVRVVVELMKTDYTLPSEFGIEETRYKDLLRARIEIDKLLELADDSNVKFIRSPLKPIPL